MPINDIAHGLRRVGKLRMGDTVETNGKTRPTKLDTWRITSPDEVVLQAAADAYGGTVGPWDNNGAAEFEVVTDTATLDVLITPEPDAFSQWNELWSGGGCQRRCDGDIEQLSGDACKCPADKDERAVLAAKGKACKATTRVSVILPRIPALGSWMVESHGYYAARELGSTFALLDMAGARRSLLPARLRIEQRAAKRDGKTNRYGVPVLDIGMRFDELVGGALPPFDPTTGEITGSADTGTPRSADTGTPRSADTGTGALPEQPALPAAAPVTSTKRAAERKAESDRSRLVDLAQQVKANDPVSHDETAALRARVDVLDEQHKALIRTAMKTAGLSLMRPPTKTQGDAIVDMLLEVEGQQAAKWEDRRVRVAAVLSSHGLTDDQRHQFISDATGGAAASMKTLTEEQTTLVMEAAGAAVDPPEQQTFPPGEEPY